MVLQEFLIYCMLSLPPPLTLIRTLITHGLNVLNIDRERGV